MSRTHFIPRVVFTLVASFSTMASFAADTLPRNSDEPLAMLGSQLYFDKNLSINRNQSCATCHNPAKGFVDDRDNGVNGMASLGSDGKSIGDRNAPTAAYAAFTPVFHLKKGEYVGGMFHDGRANTLADQAAGPPLNPAEMGLTSKQLFVDRIKENPAYVIAFQKEFGAKILADSEKAYEAMSQAIMAFEQTDLFMPFDSKYDRYLRGEVKLSQEEELGKTLFFSEQFTNCNECHQLSRSPIYNKETFTNYQYRNIGVPENVELRQKNGVAGKDFGLLNNPAVDEATAKGKFKVPSLRNIAVTGPYMHNGVFQNLTTVIHFYDKYNNPNRKLNPETGRAWAAPEVVENLDLATLEKGPALDERRVNALVAFLKTLTDKRYESQIK
ncbi:methylamine utilization protein MauG [Marinomonas agarivorans]|nr:methylamine utilization protein MauG [Marinomonas agarivorans]